MVPQKVAPSEKNFREHTPGPQLSLLGLEAPQQDVLEDF